MTEQEQRCLDCANCRTEVDGGKYTYKCELSKKKNLECIREITDHFKEV